MGGSLDKKYFVERGGIQSIMNDKTKEDATVKVELDKITLAVKIIPQGKLLAFGASTIYRFTFEQPAGKNSFSPSKRLTTPRQP